MFPKVNPKQSFPELEEKVLAFWKENDTFQKSIDSRPAENPYRFYDGPPFITGTPHYGSLLSSIIKDIIPRYQTMQGKRVERKWGWDCHGLPIEEKVQKKLGLKSNKDIEDLGIQKFIEGCYTYTKETSAEWDWYIDHIGRWVDMENAYKTMDQDYMESVLWVFKSMWDKDMIYKGRRVSLYSWKLSTPISNFEVAMDDSYEEVSDPAITVMFPLTESTKHVQEGDYIIAWTTTPWTIPAHMSMALNQNLAYSRVESEEKVYILATARVETIFKGREYKILESFMGKDLIGLKYKAPFDFYVGKVDPEKNHRVLHADFITDSDGTGIGHQAPEFGDVDFQLAKEKGVHISTALDDEGKYTEEISDYEGMHYQEANEVIPGVLKDMGLLFKKESINHRVAMCPRSGTPLIYKAQDSWFINIQAMKDKLIAENEGINWQPNHLKHGQFLKSMESAPDWCISRTRYWGTPMPIWKNSKEELNILGSKKEIFEANKPFEQLEEKDGTYFFKSGEFEGKELDLHRPFIDDVFTVNTENFVAKKVLGIHGHTSNIESEKRVKQIKQFKEAGMELKMFQFNMEEDPSYESWEETFKSINFDDYDVVYTSSLGGLMTTKYILENDIKIKRLVMAKPGKSINTINGNRVNTSKIHEDIKDKELTHLVEEIVTIHAKDDDDVFFQDGKNFAEQVGATLIERKSGGHPLNGHIPLLIGIVKHGEPMQRTPEVLDVWMDSGSMPYAQMHYPFENNTAMESSYPADFIVEYIGQVRAWFYVMHVVGVALFDKRAFTNVITTGIVMGSDGRKMSKSYGNYPDPKITIQKYGADAIRFYMANSPLLSGGNMDFKEEGILEVIKKVILPFWNTYSFFTTYANIDGFESKQSNLYYVRHGQTDNNKNRIVNGGNDDLDLNDTGRQQARDTAETIRKSGIKFDRIVSSPLARALNTAEIIKKELGLEVEIEIVEGIKEMDYGPFKGQKIEDIIKNNKIGSSTGDVYEHIINNSGAETLEQFKSRVFAEIQKLEAENTEEKILIVGHSGGFRAIESSVQGVTEVHDYFSTKGIANAQLVNLGDIKSNPLDAWVLSETHKLVSDVKAGMDSYEITDATRPIVKFMDNLTNWYIRRSRKRFWKSENDGDKMEAYETLYEVLKTLSQVTAPFMPFVSEHIYQNLAGQESVHLTYFPIPDDRLINTELNESMDLCQKIINLGLALRTSQKMRVRQPLQSISTGIDFSDYYKDIIKEELNIKEVLTVDSNTIASKICKPNGRLIGPKFGKDVKFIIQEAKAGNFEEIDENTVKVGDFVLEGDEFEIAYTTDGEEDNIESGFGMVITMDLELTNELRLEGNARDIVRHIQEARKEAGYQVDDRITINIIVDDFDAIKDSYDIESETLSTIDTSLTSGDIEKDIELGEKTAKIILKK